MLSVLEAVWQGRAFDLPRDKDIALSFLAGELAAVSGDGARLAEEIVARERGHNCSIGLGVACPHAGSPEPGELLCALGWSEEGLDYGACNGKPVHLLIMFRIPENKRSDYLQEMAAISRALKTLGEKPVATEKDRDRFFETLLEQSQAPAPGPSKVGAAFRPRAQR